MKYFTKNFIIAINYLKNKYNQRVISEAIELKPQSLSQIMKGKRAPTVENISKLFTVYDINPKWLLAGEGEMTRQYPKNDSINLVNEPTHRVYGKKDFKLTAKEFKITEELNKRIIYMEEVIELLRAENKRLKSLIAEKNITT